MMIRKAATTASQPLAKALWSTWQGLKARQIATGVRITNAIQLACVMFWGCSRQPKAISIVYEQLQPGRDLNFAEGRVLHVTNRNGNLIEGIRLDSKTPEGTSRIEAATGSVSDSVSSAEIRIVLTNAHVSQVGADNVEVSELTMHLLKRPEVIRK